MNRNKPLNWAACFFMVRTSNLARGELTGRSAQFNLLE